eukprot:4384495-Alexandrium_andersonii.AAC.1
MIAAGRSAAARGTSVPALSRLVLGWKARAELRPAICPPGIKSGGRGLLDGPAVHRRGHRRPRAGPRRCQCWAATPGWDP